MPSFYTQKSIKSPVVYDVATKKGLGTMLITHEPNKDYKAAVDKAISEAKEIRKSLKTFETEPEPIAKETTKEGHTVTEVTLKATGADKNYSQYSMNYLKGEIEGHGNEASDTFSKLWKSQHMPKGDDVSPWIGRKTYLTIVNKLTGVDNNANEIGYGLLKGKCYDPADLQKWDAKRQEFEKTLQAKAPAIVSAVRQQYNAALVLTATMSGKIEYKDLEKDFVSKITQHHEATKTAAEYDEVVETQTITDKENELKYINETLSTTRGTFYLYGKLSNLIQNSGKADYMKAQAEAMEEAKPLIEGAVKDYQEEQAKAARAAAREDKKADRDAELKANIVEAFEIGTPLQTIVKLTKVSQAKAEEILTAAGYDPAKPYSEQAKAKVEGKINFTTAMDKTSANDKDAKLRQTILDMHRIFTSEEIAK